MLSYYVNTKSAYSQQVVWLLGDLHARTPPPLTKALSWETAATQTHQLQKSGTGLLCDTNLNRNWLIYRYFDPD